jgi:hypothetical protein
MVVIRWMYPLSGVPPELSVPPLGVNGIVQKTQVLPIDRAATLLVIDCEVWISEAAIRGRKPTLVGVLDPAGPQQLSNQCLGLGPDDVAACRDMNEAALQEAAIGSVGRIWRTEEVGPTSRGGRLIGLGESLEISRIALVQDRDVLPLAGEGCIKKLTCQVCGTGLVSPQRFSRTHFLALCALSGHRLVPAEVMPPPRISMPDSRRRSRVETQTRPRASTAPSSSLRGPAEAVLPARLLTRAQPRRMGLEERQGAPRGVINPGGVKGPAPGLSQRAGES